MRLRVATDPAAAEFTATVAVTGHSKLWRTLGFGHGTCGGLRPIVWKILQFIKL